MKYESPEGVKRLVRFYDTHGNLGQVAAASGVPLGRLIDWMKEDGELSDENMQKLVGSMAHNG